MKPLQLVLILLFYPGIFYAQHTFEFKQLRQDEDYSSLKNDTSRSSYDKLKYSPLRKNTESYLSIGGDMRHQIFYVENENWGDTPDEKDGYIFSRFITHADLHVGKSLRTFVQLQSSLAMGKKLTSPVDENALDLQQVFVDFNIRAGYSGLITFRTGRQELMYGAQRLVSVGEGPNNRQAFDAFKAGFENNLVSTNVFYSQHVIDRKGIFDDKLNEGVKLFGGYFTTKDLPVLNNADLYYLGLSKRSSTFDDGEGRELRHSIGTRIWGMISNWQYDFEGVYQFGTFSGKQIRAWTISSNTSLDVRAFPFKPRIGMKSELISGDKNYGDNRLQTFNPLFPRGAYFGLAALIGPVNLFDVHPYIILTFIDDKLIGELDYDAFWRFSENDGLYGPNVALIYSGKNDAKKFIGHQAAMNLEYAPNRFFSITAEITWFKAKGYLKAVSPGKDILFTGLTTQFKF